MVFMMEASEMMGTCMLLLTEEERLPLKEEHGEKRYIEI